MKQITYPFPRLGIVGGGQLGKMLVQAASKLSIPVTVLDPSSSAPACVVTDKIVTAPFDDLQGYMSLARNCDVITVEREDISILYLQSCIDEGCQLFPSPDCLAILQDKFLQKQWLVDQNIPTCRFQNCDDPSLEVTNLFGYPLVQKAKQGGFDGRGVQVIRGPSDAGLLFQVPSILETVVDIEMELAVMVARGQDGEVVVYPVTEMVFESKRNILDHLIVPARVSLEKQHAAQDLARHCVNSLKLVGLVGVELFLTKSGELLVNEISPRPHNSGHYTIEACQTSQYEQHIRAIMGWPLGSPELLCPAVMVNLLGEGQPGNPQIRGFREAMAMSGVFVHLYGKERVLPGRKMGHVVILDDDVERAISKALEVKSCLGIFGVLHDEGEKT